MQRLAMLAGLALAACGGPLEPGELKQASRAPADQADALASSLPVPVSAAAAVAHDGRVYVAGGLLQGAWPESSSTTACAKTVHRLDPDTGTLTAVGLLPAPNHGHLLFSVPGGDLLTAMGFCGGNTAVENDVYALRLGGSTRLGAVPVGAFYPAGGLVQDGAGKPVLLLAGGYGSGPEREQVQRFDLANNSSRQLTVNLPRPRLLAAGATSGNTLYVLGGSDAGVLPPTVAQNPLSDEIVAVTLEPESVAVVGKLPEPLAGACAVSQSDGTVLVFGGAHYVPAGSAGLKLTPTDAVLRFDPATGEVTTSATPLPGPRAGLACASLPDDRVFLFGGAGPDLAPTATATQFLPSAYLARVEAEQAALQAQRYRVALGCSASGAGPTLALLAAWALRRRRARSG